MTRDEALLIIDDLDTMPLQVSDWEADFLDSLMKQSDRPTWKPTDKQVATLLRMKEKYL